MKIVKISIHNFLKLKDVEMNPSQTNVIVGKNKQGKTSILKAIRAAFTGDVDATSIRIGEGKAEITVELDNLSIKRTITEKFGDMYIWGNFGENFYQALLLGLEKPYSEGWALQVSYALSETRGDVELPESGYTFLSSFKDAFSSMDERHRLTVNGMVDLPFGFRIAGIVSVASPTPIAATVGMDLNDNNNFADDWPNNERNSVRPDANKITNWYKNIDLRIIKNFPTQYGNLELTAEAFNVFNWRNNSAYGSRMSDAKGSALVNFGQATGAYLARQIQLGVKYGY